MSLDKANINWSAKNVKNMVAKGNINFDHIVQRSYVWERKRKSALIESMILGYPIPPIYAKRTPDESGKANKASYAVMDGKQRLSTVAQYLNDEFALTDLEPVPAVVDDKETEVNISGSKFSELPESVQDVLASTMFNIVYFDNLTAEEERELFKRLNAGKALSTKSRLLASCNDIEGLMNIGSHDLFTEMLTDKSRDNKNQVTLVMKAWCMLYQPIEEVSFEGKDFNPMFEDTHISDTEKVELGKVFDMIAATHAALVEVKNKAVAKKLYTETHMISLVPFFKAALDKGIEVESMAEWLIDFFDGEEVNADYETAAGNGSAKNSNITIRNTALTESFENFFAEE